MRVSTDQLFVAPQYEQLILETWEPGDRFGCSRSLNNSIMACRTVPVIVHHDGEPITTSRFGIKDTGRVWCFSPDGSECFPDMITEEFGGTRSKKVANSREEAIEWLREFIKEHRA